MQNQENYVKDKVVIITGAANGFGLLLSQKLAALGGKITMLDISGEKAEAEAAKICSDGGEAYGLACDISDYAAMKEAVQKTVERYGCVDVMVNNAGVMPLSFWADHEKAMDSWHRCIDINLKGSINGTAAVYDQMMAQQRGHVVYLSSIYANYPIKGAPVYAITKESVRYLAHSLRMECPGKIKVSVVSPTGVATEGQNLLKSIVNPAATAGIYGVNAGEANALRQKKAAGELTEEYSDPDNILYSCINPDEIAQSILYCINQPWGISISDITVRGSNEFYTL